MLLCCLLFSSSAEQCEVDERNLLYVAVTRATHYVILNNSAVDVLQKGREYPILHCMPSHVARSDDTVSESSSTTFNYVVLLMQIEAVSL